MAAKVKAETGIVTRAVGLIAEPAQAEAIIASGQADFVALARAFLDDPRWVWHAAERLGAPISYPPQYARISAAQWPGAAMASGGTGATGPLEDRPVARTSHCPRASRGLRSARRSASAKDDYAETPQGDPPSGRRPQPWTCDLRTTLPPRGKFAREIERGQVMRVVDLEGRQVGDLVALIVPTGGEILDLQLSG